MGKDKIDDLIEQGVFYRSQKETGANTIAYTPEFRKALDLTMERFQKEPRLISKSLEHTGSFKNAVESGKTAMILFAYLCFYYNEDPLKVESFELLHRKQEKEIEDAVAHILAFVSAVNEEQLK